MIPFLHKLADASAEAILPHFGQPIEVEAKADNSPVSIADKAAEEAIRALIAEIYPEHDIFGEEFGTLLACSADGPHEPEAAGRTGGSGSGGETPPKIAKYTWVIDPIDGTRAFLEGKKEWGTLVALCEDGVPILGMLNQPATGERWIGERGSPTLYQQNSVRCRACSALDEAEISTTSALHFTPPQAAQFVKLAQACRRVVKDGDCYAYGLLARGERDLVADAGLKPYDILALVPIIRGAGGTITAWDGAEITLTHYATALASGSKALHMRALALLDA